MGDVYHSFTHFDLKLEIWKGKLDKSKAGDGVLIKRSKIISAGLPSIFKKVAKVMLENDK